MLRKINFTIFLSYLFLFVYVLVLSKKNIDVLSIILNIEEFEEKNQIYMLLIFQFLYFSTIDFYSFIIIESHGFSCFIKYRSTNNNLIYKRIILFIARNIVVKFTLLFFLNVTLYYFIINDLQILDMLTNILLIIFIIFIIEIVLFINEFLIGYESIGLFLVTIFLLSVTLYLNIIGLTLLLVLVLIIAFTAKGCLNDRIKKCK